MKLEKIRTLIFLLTIFAALFLVISCGSKKIMPTSQLDTPEHYNFTGLKLLDQGKYADSQRAFRMAVQRDKNYSRAYTGMALVNIETGKFSGAWDNLEQGYNCARTEEEKILVSIGRIRYYTAAKPEPKWLDLAKNQFDEAVKLDPQYSPAYYFMGVAYKTGMEFDLAGQMFSRVVKIKADHMADANAQLKILQDIQKAMPATMAGKQIALVERVTRADAAALFIQEMKIDVLYDKINPGKSVISSPEAEGDSAEPKSVKLWAKDIANNPYRLDIERILEIGVSNLENDPSGNFKPGEILSRCEYAMMLEDILMKVKGDVKITINPKSQKQLFPDVRPDLPYYNAIMILASRGVMSAKDLKTGEFAPLKPLSGVEALLIARKFKEEFKIN